MQNKCNILILQKTGDYIVSILLDSHSHNLQMNNTTQFKKKYFKKHNSITIFFSNFSANLYAFEL